MSKEIQKAIGKMVRASIKANQPPADSLYFDKQGKKITEMKWNELRENEGYCIVGQFENEKVQLAIEWIGSISENDRNNLFPTQYPLFAIHQFDKLDNGNWTEAPEHGKTFSKLKDANAYYEDFLLSWTESYIEEDGSIVEVGNKLAPPPPEDLAKPIGQYDEMTW